MASEVNVYHLSSEKKIRFLKIFNFSSQSHLILTSKDYLKDYLTYYLFRKKEMKRKDTFIYKTFVIVISKIIGFSQNADSRIFRFYDWNILKLRMVYTAFKPISYESEVRTPNIIISKRVGHF